MTRAEIIRLNRELRPQGEKWCPGCETAKPLTEFPKNRAHKDGHAGICSKCNAAECRAKHAANPEPYRERACAWQREHPEAVRLRARKAASARRARVRDAFVEDIDPQVVYERDEGVCGICLDPVERDEFDVDHIVPLALGGEHSYENVRTSHASCNRQRGRSVSLATVNVG